MDLQFKKFTWRAFRNHNTDFIAWNNNINLNHTLAATITSPKVKQVTAVCQDNFTLALKWNIVSSGTEYNIETVQLFECMRIEVGRMQVFLGVCLKFLISLSWTHKIICNLSSRYKRISFRLSSSFLMWGLHFEHLYLVAVFLRNAVCSLNILY